MPIQTVGGTMYFPDGCKVSAKAVGGAYTDMGVMIGDAKAALQWKENQVTTANYGKTAMQIKDMTIDGSFTLASFDPAKISILGGGLFTTATTAAAPLATIPVQVIAAGWADRTRYHLMPVTSSTDSTKVKFSTTPVLTSVVLDAAGTPETLTAWGSAASGDYTLEIDAESPSGYSIIFNSASMADAAPTTKAITVTYGTNTPVARTTMYAGSSTSLLGAVAIKFEHTDSAGKVRGVEIPSANPKSGGFAFGFKGADSDGVEQMDITFTGVIDSTLTDGRQLMSWYSDTGAL